LKPGGEGIDLTNANRQEYVDSYVEFRLQFQIKGQLEALAKGFHSLIRPSQLQNFTVSELDLLICGLPDIHAELFPKMCCYQFPYTENHPVIQLFFAVISEWSTDCLAKLLYFITGSSQVPASEEDQAGYITIGEGGPSDRLLESSECVKWLRLPAYETWEQVNDKFATAMKEPGFGNR
jgi:E3 ubiquitin-protein ligase NEDD4